MCGESHLIQGPQNSPGPVPQPLFSSIHASSAPALQAPGTMEATASSRRATFTTSATPYRYCPTPFD